jgi:hypothetical protein
LPIGHVCIEASNDDPLLQTSPANGIYSMSAFYVSRALQGSGLGTLALEAFERLVADQFGGRAVTIDTIHSSEMEERGQQRRAAMKKPEPTVSFQSDLDCVPLYPSPLAIDVLLTRAWTFV